MELILLFLIFGIFISRSIIQSTIYTGKGVVGIPYHRYCEDRSNYFIWQVITSNTPSLITSLDRKGRLLCFSNFFTIQLDSFSFLDLQCFYLNAHLAISSGRVNSLLAIVDIYRLPNHLHRHIIHRCYFGALTPRNHAWTATQAHWLIGTPYLSTISSNGIRKATVQRRLQGNSRNSKTGSIFQGQLLLKSS